MIKKYTKSYLVFTADLSFLRSTAQRYKTDALLIKGNNSSGCTPTFHLLSSLVFELFPKVLIGYEICLKYKDSLSATEEDIIKEILNEISKYNHNLEKLYKRLPELLGYLGVEEVFEFKNGFAWEYRFKLKEIGTEIPFKNFEAVRYGSFSKNKDIMTLCVYDELIISLLNKLDEYVEKQERKINNILK